MTTILPTPTVDYTDRDFASLRFRIMGLIRSVFPDWTSFQVADFANLLIEAFCFTGDVLGFYQDRHARESFWPTLVTRLAAIRHGRLFGFRLSSPTPSTGSLTFTLQSGAASVAVPVPIGTRCRTALNPGTKFRTTEAGTIAVGQSSVTVDGEQAIAVQETFASTGTPNQELVLANVPFIDESGEIEAANGDYTRVDSFLGQLPTARVYVEFTDQNNRGHIKFGNGVNGALPTGTITVDYKTGGGAAGNVDANQIVVLEDTLVDGNGQAVSARVTNGSSFSGGTDRMTVAQAKLRAPQSLRSLTRSVTRDDFVNNALLVPGVARALMATRNEDESVSENTGLLYVVAQGTRLSSGRYNGASPSSTLLTAVETMVTITRPHTLTFVVTVLAAIFRTINVAARVYFRQGVSKSDTADAIREAIADFFAAQLSDATPNTDVDFGANLSEADGTITGELVWSDVFNVIRDVSGVRKVDEGSTGLLLNSLRQSVYLEPREFPVLGTVTLTDADTGSAV